MAMDSKLAGLVPDSMRQVVPQTVLRNDGTPLVGGETGVEAKAETKAEEKAETKPETKAEEKAEEIRDWNEVKKIIAERNELRTKYKAVDQELAAIREERKALEKAKRAETRGQELDSLEKSGEYKKALAKVLEEKDSEVRDLREKITKRIIPSAISEAAMSIQNLDPTAIPDLHLLMGNRIRVNEDTMEPYVADDDGKPMKDAMLEPVSVKAYVEQFVKARPRMLIDRQVKTTGLKPGPMNGGEAKRSLESAMKDPKAMADWQRDDPKGYEQAIADRFFKDTQRKAQERLTRKE